MESIFECYDVTLAPNLAPGLRLGVVQDQFAIATKALEKVFHRLVDRRRKQLIDVNKLRHLIKQGY